MPVKRRVEKRRLDPAAEAAAWATLFESEFDYFGDLKPLNVTLDAHGRADRADAEAAWHRLGAIFLANRKPDPFLTSWALTAFGEPTCQ